MARTKSRPYRRYGAYPSPPIRRLFNSAASGLVKSAGRRLGDYAFGGRKIQSGVGVTAQHDVATVYRRKRMPRRKKARWVKLIKQVTAVGSKTLGTKNYVYNNALQFDNAAFEQAVGSIALYGGCATGLTASTQGYNALRDLFNVATNPVATNPEQVNNASALHFTSAVMDVTMRNASTVETMELDVYEMWCYGNCVRQTTVETIEQAFADAASNTTNFTGVGVTPGLARRGTTPFDIPHFFRQYRWKVVKKKKYILGPGLVATYQIRDARNKPIARSAITENECFAYGGWTKVLLFLAKNVVKRDSQSPTGQTLLDVGYTLTYHWKNPLKNDTTSGHN